MEKNSDATFFGAELRRARLAAGIKSQEELADELGFERTAIAKAESGYRPPSPELAQAYAKKFPQLNGQGCGQSRFSCSQGCWEADEGEEQVVVVFGFADGGGDVLVAVLADEAHD